MAQASSQSESHLRRKQLNSKLGERGDFVAVLGAQVGRQVVADSVDTRTVSEMREVLSELDAALDEVEAIQESDNCGLTLDD